MTELKSVLMEVIRRDLTPVLLATGFTPRRNLTWRRGESLEVRVIVDSKANDPYQGGAFTLEFETSDDGRFLTGFSGRTRINQLLDPQQRRVFLSVRNAISSSLVRPEGSYFAGWPESLISEYFKAYSVADELERQFWMRFRRAEDVEKWCDLIVDIWSTVVERAASIDPHELVLGRVLEW